MLGIKKKIFDKQHSQMIIDAVARAEKVTDAEIVVRVVREAFDKKAVKDLRSSGYKNDLPTDPASLARLRAEFEFYRLGIENTEHSHGILIHVSMKEHRVDLIADTSIKEKLGDTEVIELCSSAGEKVIEGFKTQTPAEGIVEAVEIVGAAMESIFPKTDGDKDELCNKLVQG